MIVAGILNQWRNNDYEIKQLDCGRASDERTDGIRSSAGMGSRKGKRPIRREPF